MPALRLRLGAVRPRVLMCGPDGVRGRRGAAAREQREAARAGEVAAYVGLLVPL